MKRSKKALILGLLAAFIVVGFTQDANAQLFRRWKRCASYANYYRQDYGGGRCRGWTIGRGSCDSTIEGSGAEATVVCDGGQCRVVSQGPARVPVGETDTSASADARRGYSYCQSGCDATCSASRQPTCSVDTPLYSTDFLAKIKEIVDDDSLDEQTRRAKVLALTDAKKTMRWEVDEISAYNDVVGSEFLSCEEYDAVMETNALRRRFGLAELRLDLRLCAAARDHSNDMTRYGFFGHYSRVGGKRTPWERANRYGTSASAENIAGVGNGRQAVRMWIGSGGHLRNMLGSHCRVGLGGSRNNMTQMFGR